MASVRRGRQFDAVLADRVYGALAGTGKPDHTIPDRWALLSRPGREKRKAKSNLKMELQSASKLRINPTTTTNNNNNNQGLGQAVGLVLAWYCVLCG